MDAQLLLHVQGTKQRYDPLDATCAPLDSPTIGTGTEQHFYFKCLSAAGSGLHADPCRELMCRRRHFSPLPRRIMTLSQKGASLYLQRHICSVKVWNPPDYCKPFFWAMCVYRWQGDAPDFSRPCSDPAQPIFWRCEHFLGEVQDLYLKQSTSKTGTKTQNQVPCW